MAPSPDAGVDDGNGGASTDGAGGMSPMGNGGSSAAGATGGVGSGSKGGLVTGGAPGGMGNGGTAKEAGAPHADAAPGAGGTYVDGGSGVRDAAGSAISDASHPESGTDGGSCSCLGPATYAIPLQIKSCMESPTCGGAPDCFTSPGGTLKATVHPGAGGRVSLDTSSVDSLGLFGFYDLDVDTFSNERIIAWGTTIFCNSLGGGPRFDGFFDIEADCTTGAVRLDAYCSEDTSFNNCPGPSHDVKVTGHATFVPAPEAICAQ